MAVFLYLEGISSIYVLTAFAYIGAFVGDQSSYLMGRIFGSKMLKWNIFKKRTKQVERTKIWFDKYKFGAILLGRMTPSIRPFAPFFVGTFRLNYRTFLFFDLIACTAVSYTHLRAHETN